MQYAPTGVRSTSTNKEHYPCRWPDICRGVCNTPLSGYDQLLPKKNTTHADGRVYAGAYAIRLYRAMNNFYRKRILSMRTAGYMQGRMLLRPYWVGNNFYRKRILPMRMAGHMRGRMQYAPTWCDQFLPIKNTTHADGWVYIVAYAFAPLLGCDQFLLIKNISHVDSRVYAEAYAIRPYRVTTNFYR